MHCPYCGEKFRKEELFTPDQREYLRQVVRREVTPVIVDELRRIARSTLKGPHWSFKAGPVQPLPPVPEPPIDPQADSQLQCPDCDLRFQVDGIFGYCPGCLSENLRLYDANLALIMRELASPHVSTRQLRHAYADLVSTFEIFCRKEAARLGIVPTRMQNLEVARKSFLNALQLDILSVPTAAQNLDLRRVFQKRHIAEHNDNVIDHKYVKAIPEDTQLIGTKAKLSGDELERAAQGLRQVLAKLVDAR